MTAERVLVSGGAGFIGSHLVDGLLEAGHEVRVLDDFSSGRRENLAHCLDRIDLIEGDVRDTAAVQAAVAGCANVAHLAAVASVSASFAQPAEVNCSNVGGTVKVLEAARAGDIRRSGADVGRAAVMLDWRPQYSFAQGLELTWRWYARRG